MVHEVDIPEILDTLRIPSGTRFDENNIITDTDVIVGSNCHLELGIVGKKVFVGEKTRINRDISGKEVRVDDWCEITGDVYSEGDAYIGEFVTIKGKLVVYGDLEVGSNVKIQKGFEAKGWIVIKNPIPLIVFIFLYIMELFRTGRIEEIEELLDEFEDVSDPMIIPSSAKITLSEIKVPKEAIFENGCRVHGNLRGEKVLIKGDCEFFGSVRASDHIEIEDSLIHGDVEGKDIWIKGRSIIKGDVRGRKIFVEKDVRIEGNIIGKEGVKIIRREKPEGVTNDGMGLEDIPGAFPPSG
jgi:predicted acyltransferase (DUF342 family)